MLSNYHIFLSRQSDFLKELAQYLDQGMLDMSQSICRHFMLQIALKCADISNPCRNWNISRLWSYRACEEFYRQGDRERELELPITPICDRSNISVAKVSLRTYNLHYQSSWIRDGSYNYFIFVYRFNRHFIVGRRRKHSAPRLRTYGDG